MAIPTRIELVSPAWQAGILTAELWNHIMAESIGFEPMAPFGVTNLANWLLKPLGQLSILFGRRQGTRTLIGHHCPTPVFKTGLLPIRVTFYIVLGRKRESNPGLPSHNRTFYHWTINSTYLVAGMGFEPMTLSLWGLAANHCITLTHFGFR